MSREEQSTFCQGVVINLAVTEEDLDEAQCVLNKLDEENKLGHYRQVIVPIMAPYYAQKRIAKKNGDMTNLMHAFNEQIQEVQRALPNRLFTEVFGFYDN